MTIKEEFREYLRESALNEADYTYIIYPDDKKYYVLTKKDLMSSDGGQMDNNGLIKWKMDKGINKGVITANPRHIKDYKEISFDEVKKLELKYKKQQKDDDIHSHKHPIHKNR